jgi:hypothetical protein
MYPSWYVRNEVYETSAVNLTDWHGPIQNLPAGVRVTVLSFDVVFGVVFVSVQYMYLIDEVLAEYWVG